MSSIHSCMRSLHRWGRSDLLFFTYGEVCISMRTFVTTDAYGSYNFTCICLAVRLVISFTINRIVMNVFTPSRIPCFLFLKWLSFFFHWICCLLTMFLGHKWQKTQYLTPFCFDRGLFVMFHIYFDRAEAPHFLNHNWLDKSNNIQFFWNTVTGEILQSVH